jgi:hypothetical protein
MATTKIYENTTNESVDMIGVGVIPAHDRISVTSEFPAPVNLENYPGVIDVIAEEEAEAAKVSAEKEEK